MCYILKRNAEFEKGVLPIGEFCDGHLTEFGNSLMAKRIAEYLLREYRLAEVMKHENSRVRV